MSEHQDEISKVYEVSVKSYIDSITASISDFFAQFLDNEFDVKFLIDWGSVLPNVELSPSDLHSEKLADLIASSIDEETLLSIEKDLLSVITKNKSAVLVQDTMRKVNAYVRQYDIKTRGVDNYKVRYFMGLVILEHLNKHKEMFTTNPRVLRGVANLLLLNCLYQTLNKEENASIPDDMFKKFKICLLEEKGHGLKNIFGEFGLYLIFKTLSKSLKKERTEMAYALLPDS